MINPHTTMQAQHEAQHIRQALQKHADPIRAQALQGFFKTGPGQYAEGDVFWGIYVPVTRGIVKQFLHTSLPAIEYLLEDPVHEARLCALLLLVAQYKKADADERTRIIELYVRRTDRINNWDLVDISAGILGDYLQNSDRALLYRLAKSSTMWEQRIAVVATHVYIRQGDFTDILNICEMLLSHKHDLMHKAMGWMLREVGKKDRATLIKFLQQHVASIPRTMLRYAIEHFPEDQRQIWLKKPRIQRKQ